MQENSVGREMRLINSLSETKAHNFQDRGARSKWKMLCKKKAKGNKTTQETASELSGEIMSSIKQCSSVKAKSVYIYFFGQNDLRTYIVKGSSFCPQGKYKRWT